MHRDEPPEVYDWPGCQEYGMLLGDIEGEEINPDTLGCGRCPIKHRCSDGKNVIQWKRQDAMFYADFIKEENR